MPGSGQVRLRDQGGKERKPGFNEQNERMSSYKYKAKFLLITTEETSTVMSYIEKNGYTFPVYFQRNTLPSSFRVTAIPQTYVIDRDENIIFSKTGAAKWDSNEFKEFFERIITH